MINNGTFDYIEILRSASIVVKIDFFILLMFSIVSWGIILKKYLECKSFIKRNHYLFYLFSNTNTSLLEFNNQVLELPESPLKLVFDSGFEEYKYFLHIRDSKQIQLQSHFANFGLTIFSRALKRGENESIALMNKTLNTLASIGSISPFVGLFGTVWGIINSFASLSTSNASLQSVAPGIAEALIATAVGLVAAIPAVWFYNYFDAQIDDMRLEIVSFKEAFVNKIERSLL